MEDSKEKGQLDYAVEKRTFTYNEREYEVDYDPTADVVVVELEKPLVFGKNETHTRVVLDNPNWEQIESVDLAKLTFPQIRKLATKISGLDSNRLGKIKGQDIRKISHGVIYFLQTSLSDQI